MNTPTNTYASRIAWRLLRHGSLFLAGLIFSLNAHAQAGGVGTLNGTVTNSATGDFLGGAEVRVVGTDIVTTTQRDGSFTLARLPAGPQRVHVFYTGLDVQEQDVQVPAGGTVNLSVALNSKIYQLESITVAGQREGNAAAITRQRNAENLVNVVSMDAYGDVADGNIGNFLQNMTGIAVTKEAGDIVGIGVRGAPPELNSVTLDGTRMAGAIAGSTPMGDRAALIDQVPADFIKEIEFTKGNTPDQSADSLGGTVNLITKSAFDFKERVLTYRGGINLNTYRKGEVIHQQLAPLNLGKYGPTMALTYLDTLGSERKWGVALSGSYSQTINTRDRVQMTRPNLTNNISTQARQLNDANTRVRGGLSAKLEYRFDRTAQLAFSLSTNYYSFDGDRVDWNITGTNRVADYTRVSRAAIEAGGAPLDSTGLAAGIAPGFTDSVNELINATVLDRSAHETKRSHQYKAGLDFQKSWNDAKLVVGASFNPSSYDDNFWGFSPTRTGGFGVTYDASKEATRPIYTQTYGPRIGVGADYSTGWTSSRFEQPDITREEVGDVKADLKKSFSNWKIPVTFKTGYDYRHQHRWLITYRPTWLYTGADKVQGKVAATGVNDDNLAQFVAPWTYSLFNNSMMKLDTFDYRLADASFRAHPEYWPASGTTVSTHTVPRITTEDVASSYLQATFNLGRLNVLSGARIEHTTVQGVGSFSDPLSPTQTSVRVSRAYQAWYPSVHLRYTATPNLLFRGSFSTSGARPSLSGIVPNTTVSYLTDGSGLGTVTQNNPGLKPQFTRTYDFSAEYYLEPAGMISAGVYRKDISNFINSNTTVIGAGKSNGFDGQYEDFNLKTTNNLGTAFVEGIELSYNQQLRSLPKPFNGLSVFVNYTSLRTQGSYASGAAELANFVPRTYNAGITYAYKKIEARVNYHYKSGYLFTYNATLTSQTRVTDDPTMDLNFQYKHSQRLTFYADYINIFNNSPDWWHVNRQQILMSELYGARLSVGVSGRY